MRLVEARIVPAADLALGRLEPFDSASVAHYPVWKDPSRDVAPGRNLCKLGFPLHCIVPVYDEKANMFTLPEGSVPLRLFPMEGMFTRMVNTRAPGSGDGETKAHWRSPRRFPAALGQAANNARRVRRHLKTPLPVRAALVIAEREDGPFERDHDWEGEPVKVFDAMTFWRVLREERRQGRGVERFADTERVERMVWDLGSSRYLDT